MSVACRGTGRTRAYLTAVLVRDYLSLVVDGVGNRAVGVAKGNADDDALSRRSLGC